MATYYAAGLIPPEDVTLMFTDDNWGNIQRLPLANETARSGGIGVRLRLPRCTLGFADSCDTSRYIIT